MSDYYHDSWNDADECQPTEEEVIKLENEISDLKEEIEARAEDEVFTLAEIMRLRDRLLNGESVYGVISDMNQLIGYHDASVRVAAATKVKEMEGV
jgi:regulator of replication initiation timing